MFSITCLRSLTFVHLLLLQVRIFQILHEPIIDAIREKLKTKTYIKGSNIMVRGALVDKMVFIIRGQMVNEGEDGIESVLTEGGVCGEELLTWCLEHSSVNKGKNLQLLFPSSCFSHNRFLLWPQLLRRMTY